MYPEAGFRRLLWHWWERPLADKKVQGRNGQSLRDIFIYSFQGPSFSSACIKTQHFIIHYSNMKVIGFHSPKQRNITKCSHLASQKHEFHWFLFPLKPVMLGIGILQRQRVYLGTSPNDLLPLNSSPVVAKSINVFPWLNQKIWLLSPWVH